MIEDSGKTINLRHPDRYQATRSGRAAPFWRGVAWCAKAIAIWVLACLAMATYLAMQYQWIGQCTVPVL